MHEPTFDPGLTQQYSSHLRRSINPDGTFNVRRTGLRDIDIYKSLVDVSWPKFFLIVITAFAITNFIFASVYMLIGIQHLKGAVTESGTSAYLSAFFFSVHTLTTVGYGNMSPEGVAANTVSALEAMTGLLGFAIATGLMYGRFSKPSARILFSGKMTVTPYQEGSALMFRIANRRTNVLMELEATVMMMTVVNGNGNLRRTYDVLPLERRKIYFLPLTWTIVHAIDQSSPLWGKTAEDLAKLQAEFLILIKAFDDTFSQTVHARYSYTPDEIIWGAKFPQIFHIDSGGDLVLELERMHDVVPHAADDR